MEETVVAESIVPAWKRELSERVREIRARREGTSPPPAPEQPAPPEPQIRPSVPPIQRKQPAPTRAATVNPIVEAAISRARRAGEIAGRRTASMLESQPAPPPSSTTYSVDRRATARALDPAADENVRVPTTTQPPISRSVEARRAALPRPSPPATEPKQYSTGDLVEPVTLPVDDVEPRDYLEAEIRKVDRALAGEFAHNESPSFLIHAVFGTIDLLAIAAAWAPFLALIDLFNGSFSNPATLAAAIGIGFLIATFYLVLTQTLCGRTFGMMLTNTRLVDARTFEQPPLPKIILRTIGCYISGGAGLIGLIWAAFNTSRRGWHDYLSGTMVSRDF